MEEKIIIKSELYNIKLIRNIFYLIGLIGGLFTFIIVMSNMKSYYEGAFIGSRGKEIRNMNLLQYILEEMGFGCHGFWEGLAVIVVFVIIGTIFYSAASKIDLTVTNMRVFGNAAFGKRVDLPLDMISAVGTSALKGIAVTTSSGAIKFMMIKNSDEIHTAISKLLVERQNKTKEIAQTVVKQEVPQSNADELKKYKDLLDSGVITQEEFDAKKKQLLGL